MHLIELAAVKPTDYTQCVCVCVAWLVQHCLRNISSLKIIVFVLRAPQHTLCTQSLVTLCTQSQFSVTRMLWAWPVQRFFIFFQNHISFIYILKVIKHQPRHHHQLSCFLLSFIFLCNVLKRIYMTGWKKMKNLWTGHTHSMRVTQNCECYE